jgi:arsenite methyltransferase
VVGIDITEAQLEKATRLARAHGIANAEFRNAHIERMPLEEASVDVVISNGVINLSPRKSRVFAEIFRVLRPGGRMCVSDLTVEDDLPPEIMTSDAAWAG